MLIPSKMNEMMSSFFYDKTVKFYVIENAASPEGGRLKNAESPKGQIQCNIHHSINQAVREQFGITTEAKLMITCGTNELVQKGFKFKLNDHEYEVFEILPQDTHLKVVCK